MKIKEKRLYIFVSTIFWGFLRRIDLLLLNVRLRNKKFTIISNDCMGGYIYQKYMIHNLTPTLWVRIYNRVFPTFVNNLSDYISCDLVEKKSNTCDYPIGILQPNNALLPPIELHFIHYDTFEKSKGVWDSHKDRIIYDNIFVVQDATEDIVRNEQDACNFNSIKYKKILLHRKDCVDHLGTITDRFGIDFKDDYYDGKLFINIPGIKGQHFERRYFDQFNWTRWLNGKKV